jgi:Na+/H+ antiporter NhaD/arsenite permease-like protein
MGGLPYLVCIWVASFINKPDEVQSFLYSVGWSVLLVFATLFFEGVYKHKDD